MCGWLRAAAACASARNRRRKPSSSARPAWSSLTATRRRSRVSSARKTSADAPAPIGATSRYRPDSTRPTWSDILLTGTAARVVVAPGRPGDRPLLGRRGPRPGRLTPMELGIADELEAFIESGALWDDEVVGNLV